VECDGPLAALESRLHPSSRERLATRESEGVVLLVADLPHPFRAAFTTRHGGVSGGAFSSLNLSGDQGDDSTLVEDNRARVTAALTALDGGRRSPLKIVSPRQEHGFRIVGTAEYAREGTRSPCDGLTLRAPLDDGLAALLLFADCVPVILVGEVDMAVVHGGWRGLVGGVVQQGARAMTGPPGAAFVGPSIGPCCFTVGEEVAQAFAHRYGDEVVCEGPRVDLWRATERALAEVEVPAARVVNPRLCTVCNRDLFFSYRGDGPLTGRQGAVAWVAESTPETGSARPGR
jgi:polyphenol oxidase